MDCSSSSGSTAQFFPSEPHSLLNCWPCWLCTAHGQVVLQKSCPQLKRTSSSKVMLYLAQPANCYKGNKSQTPCLKTG